MPTHSRRPRVRLWSFSLLAALAALLVLGCEKAPQEAAQKPAPPAVMVVEVRQGDVPLYGEWIGVTEGMVNAQIRAQVTGYLVAQKYDEGSYVKKGQLLFQIDPRSFDAAVAQAQAQLAQAQARHVTAKANLEKILPLAKVGAVSAKDRDDAIGGEATTAAEVASAKAALQKAELDLEFTRITSPINGIAGIAQAQIGDLVGPQSNPLTTVSTLDPIKVYISASEQEYLAAMRNGANRGGQADERLQMILADGSVYPQMGKMIFADRQVDPRTGTIKVAATFPNSTYLLRPGQYAKIRALLHIQKDALLVPQRAVSDVQGNKQVAVVNAQNQIEVRPVKVGEQMGQDWLILEGVKPGEKVVAEGVQKVRSGMPVSPAPYQPGQPAAAAQPAGQR